MKMRSRRASRPVVSRSNCRRCSSSNGRSRKYVRPVATRYCSSGGSTSMLSRGRALSRSILLPSRALAPCSTARVSVRAWLEVTRCLSSPAPSSSRCRTMLLPEVVLTSLAPRSSLTSRSPRWAISSMCSRRSQGRKLSVSRRSSPVPGILRQTVAWPSSVAWIETIPGVVSQPCSSSSPCALIPGTMYRTFGATAARFRNCHVLTRPGVATSARHHTPDSRARP